MFLIKSLNLDLEKKVPDPCRTLEVPVPGEAFKCLCFLLNARFRQRIWSHWG